MSSNIIAIEASARHEFGKGASRRLRRAGRIPAVIYGVGHDPIHIHVDILEFQAIVRNHGVNAVVEVAVEGEQHLAMIKAVDQNVLTFNIDHADLLTVKRGEKVEVDVPVIYTGDAAPGALVTQDADVLTVEADVLDIPEEITVDIEGKEIGFQLLAGDIPMPSNTTLVSDPETLVINIVEPQVEQLDEDAEAETEGEAASEESESE